MIHTVVKKWFDLWEEGNVEELPLTNDFKHHSPFGTIETKEKYLELVSKNKDNFLGNSFKIIDHIQEENKVSVRYELLNKNTGLDMEVSEWFILNGDLIQEVWSYYNVGSAEIKG